MFSRIARLRAKKGFTLIELVVVIAIIGILTAMILPNILYDRRPSMGKALAKDLYYNMQDVLTSAEIAQPGEIEEGKYAFFYFTLSNIGTITATGRIKNGESGGYTAADLEDDLLLDSKIKYAAEHYTTDKDQIEGTYFLAIDSGYRVVAAYWSDETLSNLSGAKIRDNCVLTTGNYLCSFPISYCETKDSQLFVF